jgi:hypothetical protein
MKNNVLITKIIYTLPVLFLLGLACFVVFGLIMPMQNSLNEIHEQREELLINGFHYQGISVIPLDEYANIMLEQLRTSNIAEINKTSENVTISYDFWSLTHYPSLITIPKTR